jgi:hypothetical protein
MRTMVRQSVASVADGATKRGRTLMKRRKHLVGLGSLAAGGETAMGTGAFSQMLSGERSVTVQVEDDANSFLALVPAPDSDPNHHGHFAEQNGDKLEINVDGDNVTFPNGDGLNPDSEYYTDNVFKIQNYGANSNPGTGEVAQWISSNTANRVDLTYVETGSMEPTLEPGDGFVAIPAELAGPIDEGDVINNLAERDPLSILVFETVEHIELPLIAEGVKELTAGELVLESGEHGHPVLCLMNLGL